MSNATLAMNDALYQYLLTTSSSETALLAALRQETALDSMSRMQISPEQGQFMGLLVKLMGARKIIEVGTFTGYSSISMAMNTVRPAQVICCDVSEQWTNMAQRYWQLAGVDDICQLKLAPAMDTLQALIRQGESRSFDMAFIDADKENYDTYFELCLTLVRAGGLIMIDNTLWSGRVAQACYQDVDTRAIRALNQKLARDARVQISQLPIADGLTLCFKK